mgnify:CR=1 FL=1
MAYDYENFKTAVFQLTKIDLNAYKERQMKRRIDSLITKNGFKGYEDYIKALKTDREKFEEFVTYLTINVSEFYRNPALWKTLEDVILPDLIKKFGSNLKIWSAACSTGDEPYSLAMVLAKKMPLNKIHIIATDIDDQVLEKARDGVYAASSLKGLPDEYKNKYDSSFLNNEYLVCLEIILENFAHFLEKKKAIGIVYLESQNSKADNRLHNYYQQLVKRGTRCMSNHAIRTQISTFNFYQKSDLNIGLQIADFIPNTMKKYAVALKGEHFTAHKGNGDAVKKGDLLISVDLEAVKAAGYDVITPMVVCNTSDYQTVEAVTGSDVNPGDTVLILKK